MKVLVTGGAGFIGSHVCDEFLRAGHEVIALDNLSSGKRENLDPRVRLAVLDIRSPEAARADRAPSARRCSATWPRRWTCGAVVEDPRFDAERNILGMLNLLEAARAAGVKKVIFSSTGGAIYGEQDVFPAPESHATRPVSPYGVSKASGELYLGYYRAQYGLQYVALRYANVYGPRQNPHGEAGVVAIFSQRLVAGQGCTIFGDGGQTRDFVFGPDVARANLPGLREGLRGRGQHRHRRRDGHQPPLSRCWPRPRAPSSRRRTRRASRASSGAPASTRACAKVLGWEPTVGLLTGCARRWSTSAPRRASRARASG